MGKRGYREWTPTEEARLPYWIVDHPDSEWSWDMRAEEYSKTIRPRTAESLRSKLRQLRKNIRRRRPVRRGQARMPHRGTATQARKEQQRTRGMSPLATTRVPAHWMPTKNRNREARIDQVESEGQAVLAAGFSRSPPTTPVGTKSPVRDVRDRALMRSTRGSKAPSRLQPPVRGPSRAMDLVWQLMYQVAGRTRPRPLDDSHR